MPLRVQFIGPDVPQDHAAIADALAAFASDEWTVSVRRTDDGTEQLGWWVSLDKPGCHVSFRIEPGASPAEWVASLRKQVPPAN